MFIHWPNTCESSMIDDVRHSHHTWYWNVSFITNYWQLWNSTS